MPRRTDNGAFIVDVRGSEGWFMAHCSALGVAGYGPSEAEAENSLYRTMRIAARSIVDSGNQPKRLVAQAILKSSSLSDLTRSDHPVIG